MALLVEDGSVVEGAKSYVDVQKSDELVAEYGFTEDWLDASPYDKELYLRQATRSLDESLLWVSELVSPTQPLAFPRKPFTDLRGRLIEGIPEVVQVAVVEFAIAYMQGNFSTETPARLKSQSFGDSSETYAQPVSADKSVYDTYRKKLMGLGFGRSSVSIVTLERA